MTNKTMLSVERELLERAVDNRYRKKENISIARHEALWELRALLDNPAALPDRYEDRAYCEALEQERDYLREQLKKPAAQHQGEPVAGKCDQDVFDKGHSVCLVDIPKDRAEVICQSISSVTGHKIDWHYIGGRVHIKALLAEQPAPVSDHPQCEECKGWGYHENYHEGGGTECGECGGSGKATVSVVMPEPYSLAMFQMISGFESVTPEQFDLVWSACREEVSRLNGIKA